MELLGLIAIIVGIAYSIILHEVAHGWVADNLGDPTARLAGRLTLNPLPHIDFLGTIIIPLILYLSPAHFLFGYAKPVPIDQYNFRNSRKDTALVALAGPLTNIIIAIILSLSAKFSLIFIHNPSIHFYYFYDYLIAVNAGLGIFNLTPIYPLDGSRILLSVLPNKLATEYDYFMKRFGSILLILIVFPIFGSSSLILPFLTPVINILLKILIPNFSTI